jgi:hypothetical protein
LSDFYQDTNPVARFEHKCEYCGEAILEGERHVAVSAVYEGEWQNYRMHTECHAAHYRSGDEYFGPFENKRPDNCSICRGSKGGERGNENIVDGVLMCDYCHSEWLSDHSPN